MARYRTSASNWAQPIAWNKKAAEEQRTGILTPKSKWDGRIGFWPVFCASLADVFDNEVPAIWRHDLWKLIRDTPNLSWLLVTKRIGNVAKMWPVMQDTAPPNVRLLITVCNQEEADRDIPKLLELPCKNGISYEPALGPVDWTPWLGGLKSPFFPHERIYGLQPRHVVLDGSTNAVKELCRLEWIIVGGESAQAGHMARRFDIGWARSAVEQCKGAGIPVFVKQMGSAPEWNNDDGEPPHWGRLTYMDRAGADPSEWPEDLRVREFPQ